MSLKVLLKKTKQNKKVLLKKAQREHRKEKSQFIFRQQKKIYKCIWS